MFIGIATNKQEYRTVTIYSKTIGEFHHLEFYDYLSQKKILIDSQTVNYFFVSECSFKSFK